MRVVTRITFATTESGCVTIVMPITINSNSCCVIEQDFLTNQNSQEKKSSLDFKKKVLNHQAASRTRASYSYYVGSQ